MQVHKSPTVNFGKGIYFSKASNICFNKASKFIGEEGVKVSQEGFKYIEQTQIPKNIENRFKNNKFIKKLSEKFDTFVWYDEIARKDLFGSDRNVSMTKIMWYDASQKYPYQIRPVLGTSKQSPQDALDNMFEKIV